MTNTIRSDKCAPQRQLACRTLSYVANVAILIWMEKKNKNHLRSETKVVICWQEKIMSSVAQTRSQKDW